MKLSPSTIEHFDSEREDTSRGSAEGMDGHALVARYVDHKMAQGRWNATSAKTCRNMLLQLVGEINLEDIDGAAFGAWVNEAHLAARSRRTRWTVAGGFLRWVGFDLDVPSPPVPRHAPRPLADVDVAALLAVCDARDELLVSLAVCEGLRRGELARVDLADVDLAGNVMFLVGKGGAQRWVPVTDATAGRLRAYCDDGRGWADGPLLRSRKDGGRLTVAAVGEVAKRLMVKAGIKRPGVTLHSLRHTSATRLWMESSDILMVQQLLGHSSLATTQAYVASRPPEHMRRAMNAAAS